MSDLELELREKIKQARAEMAEAQPVEEEVENDIDEVEEEVSESEEVESEEAEESTQEEVSEDDDIELDDDKAQNPKAKNAFQKMRQELKQRDAAIEEMRREMAKLQGMQEVSLNPKKEEPVQVEQEPDREYEPEAWFDYQLKQRDKRLEEMSSKFDAITKQTATSQAEATYISLEGEYSQKDGTYKDAKNYYVSERARQLKEQYPAATEAQIKQEVKAEEYRLVESLAKAGFSPDDIFTTIKAKALSLGYKDNIPAPKRDNKKLKHNMSKSASLNDAPSANGDLGFSESQLKRMGSNFSEVAKLAGNKGDLKKAHDALRRARLKATT